MSSDVRENPRQCAYLERVMAGNGDVVFAALAGRKAHVVAALPRGSIAKDLQPGGQRVSREISGQLHRETTSS